MWKCPTKGTYITLEYEGIIDVCPSEDSAPHSLNGFNCACNPEQTLCDNKIMVLHTRFGEIAAIDSSMKKLFGE